MDYCLISLSLRAMAALVKTDPEAAESRPGTLYFWDGTDFSAQKLGQAGGRVYWVSPFDEGIQVVQDLHDKTIESGEKVRVHVNLPPDATPDMRQRFEAWKNDLYYRSQYRLHRWPENINF